MDGDCSHEIKKHLLLGRKSMTNLDSVFKSRDITLLTQVRLVKAMVFPVVMYEYESRTIKEAEHQRIDAFKLWCWKRLRRAPIVHATPPCSPSVLQTCVSSLHPTDLDPLTQSSQLCSLSLEFSIFPCCPPPLTDTCMDLSLCPFRSLLRSHLLRKLLSVHPLRRALSFLLHIIVCIFCSTSLSL